VFPLLDAIELPQKSPPLAIVAETIAKFVWVEPINLYTEGLEVRALFLGSLIRTQRMGSAGSPV
jgi:hypothetical protein